MTTDTQKWFCLKCGTRALPAEDGACSRCGFDTLTEIGDAASDRQQIIDELERASRRYDRLAAPPRWLHYPLVGSLHVVLAFHDRAVQCGDVRRAQELADLGQREYARRELLENWPGRSRVAWQAIADRMQSAFMDAVQAGVIDPASDSARAYLDRIHSARHFATAVNRDRPGRHW